MTTTKPESVPLIQIEVLVPVDVPAEKRARFEHSLARFLFGNDRVRPELRTALTDAGIDFNHLATLSEQRPLGLCPSPGAVEFVPTERLARVCREHGIDLTSGGCALMTFGYGAYEGKQQPPDALEIDIRLPRGAERDVAASPELTRDLVTALFGDCQLPEAARAYLRTHGVDLGEVAARNADALGGPEVPFTSRVSPEIHHYLKTNGFDVDRYGRFDVRAVDRTTTELPNGGAAWSKTTCC
ncbi:hypothetical protein ACFWIA_02630 [Streptomyces sp. NPDC127068]|uniref:hypothetical protein n=1 Tax=Streptomyces sp. NPDC127068 TaxID=3347127 RepID=UPI003666F4F8